MTLWGEAKPRQVKCSHCGGARDRKGRYCKACHAAYMRLWRKDFKDKLIALKDKAKPHGIMFHN